MARVRDSVAGVAEGLESLVTGGSLDPHRSPARAGYPRLSLAGLAHLFGVYVPPSDGPRASGTSPAWSVLCVTCAATALRYMRRYGVERDLFR